MWWDSSDCLISNSASSSHWQTASGLRRSTSTISTRSGPEIALATAASRSASRAASTPAAGAQHWAADGPGSIGSGLLITVLVVLTTQPTEDPASDQATLVRAGRADRRHWSLCICSRDAGAADRDVRGGQVDV